MAEVTQSEKPRACTNCSQAKAKCIWPQSKSDESHTCVRCSKNSLVCQKSHAISKRRRGKATHARVIEQKLDDIMTLLSRDREAKVQTADPVDVLTPAILGSTQAHSSAPLMDVSETSSSLQSNSIVVLPGFELRFDEADRALLEYTNTMLPQFPFVPLASTSAQDMLKESPLLLKTILWVCRPPGPEMTTSFETWFRQYVAHQTVVLMSKSLELVQAILVFLAWNDIYFYATAKDTSLIQLAIGLVEDLGLTHPRRAGGSTFGSVVEDAAELRDDLPPQRLRTSSSIRAVLGMYYITSISCSLLDRRSRLDYMLHFNDWCAQLEQNQEHSTDRLLTSLISIRKIALEVQHAFWDTAEDGRNGPLSQTHYIAVASIRRELEGLVNNLPDNLKENHLFQTHCAAVRIRLFEPFNNGKSEMLGSTHLRVQMKWDCLESTQALCNAFCTLPIDFYPSLTYVSILHLALAVLKALRLLCTETNDWDTQTVRTMYDPRQNLQRLAELFEAASNLGHPRCKIQLHGRPIFSEYAEAYRGIERWYLSKLKSTVVYPDEALIDPMSVNSGVHYDDFSFWNQLSDITNGLLP